MKDRLNELAGWIYRDLVTSNIDFVDFRGELDSHINLEKHERIIRTIHNTLKHYRFVSSDDRERRFIKEKMIYKIIDCINNIDSDNIGSFVELGKMSEWLSSQLAANVNASEDR